MSLIISQGYQGPRSNVLVETGRRGGAISVSGGLRLPRETASSWWNAFELPVSIALHADVAYSTTGGLQVIGWNDSIVDAHAVRELSLTVLGTPMLGASAWSDGSAAIVFDGVSSYLRHDTSMPYLQGNVARSFALVWRPSAVTGIVGELFGISNGTQRQCIGTNGTAYTSNGTATAGDDFAAGEDVLSVFTIAAGGVTVRSRGHRALIATGLVNPATPWTTARLGCGVTVGGANQLYREGLWKQFALLNTEFTDSDYRRLHSLVMGSEFANIVTLGSVPMVPTSAVLGAMFGTSRGRGIVSLVPGGDLTTVQLLAAIGTVPVARDLARNIAVVWEVARDIQVNHPCLTPDETRSSASVVVGNLWRLTQALVARGYEPIVITPIPRPGMTANQLTALALARELILTSYQVGAVSQVVDASAIPGFGVVTSPWFAGASLSVPGARIASSLILAGLWRQLEAVASG